MIYSYNPPSLVPDTEETREELKNPDTKILWSRQVKEDQDPVIKLSISKEYEDFKELFMAVKNQDALLKH